MMKDAFKFLTKSITSCITSAILQGNLQSLEANQMTHMEELFKMAAHLVIQKMWVLEELFKIGMQILFFPTPGQLVYVQWIRWKF